jgi:hypothetical protein
MKRALTMFPKKGVAFGDSDSCCHEEIKRPNSPTEFITNFNNLPEKKTQDKINYFFMPYNLKTELAKSMNFDID